MAKTIAIISDDGATIEAIPFTGSYPGDAISISEDSGGQAGDLARFEKTDVSDSFDERGICKIYKDGAFARDLIFDPAAFFAWQAQGGFSTYLWKKVPLTDQTAEQILTTGSGNLTLVNLNSGQSALPTFTGTVQVIIGKPYQARDCKISTDPSVSGGNVTFGLTLLPGVSGTPHFDIMVVQIEN